MSADTQALTFGSLFSGIGGMDLGLERAGLQCRWQVENNPDAIRCLERHWPNVRRYGDIKTVGPELERVNVIAGGFPCVDISAAGRQAGIEAERSGIANGDNPLMRVALCGYDGEHDMPTAWECVAWKTRGGYGSQGTGRGRENAGRERIWFSPHCIQPPTLFGGFNG